MRTIFVSIAVAMGLCVALVVFNIADTSKGRLSPVEIAIAGVGGLLTFIMLAIAYRAARRDAAAEQRRNLHDS